MIVLLKMHASGKTFDKICLKAIRDNLFFQYAVSDQWTGGFNFLVGVISKRREKFELFGLQGNPQFPSFSGTS